MRFFHRSTRDYLLYLLLVVPFLAPRVSSQDDWKARDAWEKPEEVMDVLGVKAGSVVADVGAGEGYFTFHLAGRVGPTGRVYAEDILDDRLEQIRKRASKEKLTQIETIHGETGDPRLPAERADVVLISNAYHEMREYDKMLTAVFRALKPGGLLAIIDAPAKPGEPRKDYYERHRIPEELVREDTARNGFAFLRQQPTFNPPDSDRTYFFLIFQKPPVKSSDAPSLAEALEWMANFAKFRGWRSPSGEPLVTTTDFSYEGCSIKISQQWELGKSGYNGAIVETANLNAIDPESVKVVTGATRHDVEFETSSQAPTIREERGPDVYSTAKGQIVFGLEEDANRLAVTLRRAVELCGGRHRF